MNDARKILKTMMMVGMMATIEGEFSKTPVDFEWSQDESKESGDIDEEDVG